MSNENAAIYKAFVKAQSQFGAALKTSTNPHFRSRYADLASCIEAVIDALNANGIALMQQTFECENGVMVETIFIHESGETLSSGKFHVPATKHDAQGYGSALTYARRYSLMCATGLAPTDDDGNAAAKTAPKPIAAKSVTQDVFDKMPTADQEQIRSFAVEVIAMASKEDIAGCVEYVKSLELDADWTSALWSQLDSKIRSAIKKYKEENK
jgi:hypothetical protein